MAGLLAQDFSRLNLPIPVVTEQWLFIGRLIFTVHYSGASASDLHRLPFTEIYTNPRELTAAIKA